MNVNIPAIVQAAGGEIAGRVRMQKTIYLLDQIGLGSGATYEYHYYGPYSEGLQEQVEDDVIFRKLTADERRRKRDGARYVVYCAGQDAGSRDEVASLRRQFGKPLALLQAASATVLELAATAHWLVAAERRTEWRREIVRRKGVKTEDGRLEEALGLLEALGLPPGNDRASGSDLAQYATSA